MPSSTHARFAKEKVKWEKTRPLPSDVVQWTLEVWPRGARQTVCVLLVRLCATPATTTDRARALPTWRARRRRRSRGSVPSDSAVLTVPRGGMFVFVAGVW